jgi:outer membrane protein OmpA-like peptidoglycan-associated protein
MSLSNVLSVLISSTLLCVAISDCNQKISTISPMEKGRAKSSKKKAQMEFGPIYYDNYKSVLKPEAMSLLYKVGAFLVNNEEYRLIIESYSDDRCSKPYAKWLSDERARGVHDWLSSNGPFRVDKKRITIQSYGDMRPLNNSCGNDTACHSKNRRIELIVVNP